LRPPRTQVGLDPHRALPGRAPPRAHPRARAAARRSTPAAPGAAI